MRTSGRRKRLAVAALLPALLAAGCADTDAGQRTVFPDSTGFTSVMHSKVDEVTDIGFEPFYNLTGDPIRLRGAAFVSPPPGLRVLNVRAYNYGQTRETVLGQSGDLAKECPHLFKPEPVNSYLTPPHGSSSWFVVIAYHLQTRPLQPQASQDRLHRRRPPRLAVHSHQHSRCYYQPARPRPDPPTLISGLRPLRRLVGRTVQLGFRLEPLHGSSALVRRRGRSA
jgi:hypothetical protein